MSEKKQARAELVQNSTHFKALVRARNMVPSITNNELAEQLEISSGGISHAIGKTAWSALTYLKIEKMLDALDEYRPGVKRCYYLFLLGLDDESVADIAFNSNNPVNKLLEILPLLIKKIHHLKIDACDNNTDALTKIVLGLLEIGSNAHEVGRNLDSDTIANILEGFVKSGK